MDRRRDLTDTPFTPHLCTSMIGHFERLGTIRTSMICQHVWQPARAGDDVPKAIVPLDPLSVSISSLTRLPCLEFL
jgi:hypothetical protein